MYNKHFLTAAAKKSGSAVCRFPGVMIAGTCSGVGKTSITLGLVRALTRRGVKVQPYKVGPDFLDPMYLKLAAGRTCFNLDTWMCGPDYVRELVSKTAEAGDIIVIEGAMGLFDGADADSIKGSAAEIARLLNAPVVLVCDAYGQARSLAATVKGFSTFEPGVSVCGVIANYCGSLRHADLLRQALESLSLPPLLGGIVKDALPQLKSRHLGLVSPDSSANNIEKTIDILADAVESCVSVERVLDSAKDVSPPLLQNGESPRPLGSLIRLGIASDAAFQFYYPDNLAAFEACGATIVLFSPLSDPALPEGLDGLYIGGGYPELFADALSNNRAMAASIQAFCLSGRPVYAECGGLMYLSQGIIDADNACHPMVGILPSLCRMSGQIKTLGYTEVTLTHHSLWGPPGTLLRGHEFHYSELLTPPASRSGWEVAYDVSFRHSKEPVQEGYQHGNILLSYIHLHLASNLPCVSRFIELCRKNQR